VHKWLVGMSPSIWKFGGRWPTCLQIADFRSIFARSASAVTRSEKSSVNTEGIPLRAFQWAQDEYRTFPLSPRVIYQPVDIDTANEPVNIGKWLLWWPCCWCVMICVVGPTDCLLEGELLKLGGPFLQMWQRKHAKLYPNRLEFYNKSRDGQVVKGKGVEVCWTICQCCSVLFWICIAPCRDHTSKALRYGRRSQGISRLYLHTSRTSFMDRSFTAAGPHLWNNLPLHLHDFELSLFEFCRLLNTHLFGWRSRRLVTYF